MADQKKKQVPLRLSAKLYDAIAAWAEDDFRSVNGQIEYLLTECVRQICLRTSGRTDRTGYQVKPEKEYIKIRMGQRTVHKRMWTVRIFMRYNNAIRNKS